MNGELLQLVKLTSYLRYCLASGNAGEYGADPFVERISFKSFDERTAYSPVEWLKGLEDRELKDAFLWVPVRSNNREYAGFSNAERQGIVTVFDGAISLWQPRWSFDQGRRAWLVSYSEHIIEDLPEGLKETEDPSEDLKRVLTDIGEFADEIGATIFARIFNDAYSYFTVPDIGQQDLEFVKSNYIPVEGDAGRLFLAAGRSDVFGGMGSWNDDPEGMAGYKGLGDKYNRLSDELYNTSREALVYSVNTSWKKE